MQYDILRYPVKHPLLKKYIKFFWEFKADHLNLNHKIIPQRNINLRFNLSETPHILSLNGIKYNPGKVYFSGLQDHFTNINLKLSGSVHTLGICFYPDGFYPFLKIPVSEFRNQLLGTEDVGFARADSVSERLKDVAGIDARLGIIEKELLTMLNNNDDDTGKFSGIFNALRNIEKPELITNFSIHQNISLRTLERMYNKYVGLSASTFGTLNRFHNSLNRLLYNDFSKLSDLAYDHGYFDQMHFIKEFRRYTGNTPKSFINENDSILQIGKLT